MWNCKNHSLHFQADIEPHTTQHSNLKVHWEIEKLNEKLATCVWSPHTTGNNNKRNKSIELEYQ